MRFFTFYMPWFAVVLIGFACRSAGLGRAGNASNSHSSTSTIVGLKLVTGTHLELSQLSRRSITSGVKCRIEIGPNQFEVLPVRRERAFIESGNEYFLTLPNALDSALCSGNEKAVKFEPLQQNLWVHSGVGSLPS